MTQFEKVGVLVITGLVAIILALALFGTGSGSIVDAGSLDLVHAEPVGVADSLAVVQDPATGLTVPGNQVVAAPWFLLSDDSSRERELPLQPAMNVETPTWFPASGRWHVIEKGDKLYELAKAYLGAGTRFQEILDANPGLSPERLQLGQRIRIPNSSRGKGRQEVLHSLAEQTRVGSKTTSNLGTRTYTVRKGDTLSQIAKRVLDDSRQWQTLYAMNRDQLAKPTSLRPGQKLKIPAK